MSNKKIFTLVTEEYLNEMIKNIKIPEGKSAYQIAVEQGFTGTEKEWIESLRGKDGVLDINTVSDILETEDKRVIGAINELFKMIKDWMDPVYDIKSQMFYGVIDPTTAGVITTYADVTIDMLNNEAGVKSTIPGERLSLSIGHVDEGSYIIVAVPAIYNFTVTKDNGFGGRIEFDESIIGANGIDVEFDKTDYRIYGEFVLVGGERIIYIDQPEEPTGGNCGCVDLTAEDIAEVISDVFDSEE